jgi:hypothetical protein
MAFVLPIRLIRALCVLISIGLSVAGCATGRRMTVRDAKPADVGKLRGAKIEKVYFKPFERSGVKLEGDHGKGKKLEENQRKWFTHVVVGAQGEFNRSGSKIRAVLMREKPSAYDREVFERTKADVATVAAIPPGSIVVSGKYLFSGNVGTASRAVFGSFSGKSLTQAAVSIRKGKSAVFSCTVDGKYYGGGIPWEYETLSANEGLGHGIADLIVRLQKGEEVRSE